jgi:hypothetical protein
MSTLNARSEEVACPEIRSLNENYCPINLKKIIREPRKALGAEVIHTLEIPGH